jgi:hypothetical protein
MRALFHRPNLVPPSRSSLVTTATELNPPQKCVPSVHLVKNAAPSGLWSLTLGRSSFSFAGEVKAEGYLVRRSTFASPPFAETVRFLFFPSLSRGGGSFRPSPTLPSGRQGREDGGLRGARPCWEGEVCFVSFALTSGSSECLRATGEPQRRVLPLH